MKLNAETRELAIQFVRHASHYLRLLQSASGLYHQGGESSEHALGLFEDARANIARIEQIWTECRERYGQFGPFLFGAFGAADAMFAPVVHRFRTYAIEMAPEAQDYMNAMRSLPAFEEWTTAGLAETLVIAKFEMV